ncbi:dihydrofolate reductase family protein [Arthrobacter sp. Sa2BUA2]|uniref:Dihydrofolate reductase family protein n=1 Tax=Arthrobacter pullicola TaxID=2762224 RepID=A0ABR8YJ07_9MICC|nr:dihydrofolate reductase family protein [Arthrobacter pullicola]MBD8044093.1 dihydrofolate reductase family protein [Arthrobacter pullicola]
MGTLIFTATVSLDGYVSDQNGDFQWTGPSDDMFALHVDRMGEVSTEVLGRKTYALMEYWEKLPDTEDQPAPEREFARRWRDINKVVVSSTMTDNELASGRARIVPQLSLAELQQIVKDAEGMVEIFGPTTAADAIRAGLVDEFRLVVVPKLVGGGLRALPGDVQLDLRLAEQRVFANGTVYLRYLAGRG